MIISRSQVNQVISSYLEKAQKGQSDPVGTGNSTTRPSGGDPRDILELSPVFHETKKVKAYLDRLPDTRTARVADLKRQIATGSYQVDGQQVAEKMLGRALVDRFIQP